MIGVAAGDEFLGNITKVENGEITYQKLKEGKDYFSRREKERTLPAASDIKVLKAKPNPKAKKLEKKLEPDGELPGGLQNENLTKIEDHRGILAHITTDKSGKKITELWVSLRRSKRKGQ